MFLTKQVNDHLQLLLAPIQMAAHDGHEFGTVGRLALAEPVGLDVLIQQFIGVQFRAVARYLNQSQSRRVLGRHARGGSGFVHRIPVHDEIDLAGNLFEQPLHERHKDGCLASEALAGGPHDRVRPTEA